MQALSSTIAGQAERTFESTRQTTWTDPDNQAPKWVQYALGKMSSKTLGWDYNQVEYLDAWGRPEESGDTLERAVANFINPSYVDKIEMSPVEKELQRLYDLDNSADVFPDRVTSSTKVDGSTLTADKYSVYAAELGQTSYDTIEELIGSNAYSRLNAADKQDAIEDVYDYAKAIAAMSIGRETNNSRANGAIQAEKEAGISPAEFLIFVNNLSDFSADKDANGNSISGSKKSKVVSCIDGLDISVNEKNRW